MKNTTLIPVRRRQPIQHDSAPEDHSSSSKSRKLCRFYRIHFLKRYTALACILALTVYMGSLARRRLTRPRLTHFLKPTKICQNCNRTWNAMRKKQAVDMWDQLNKLEEARCPLLSTTLRKPSRAPANSPKAAICAIARYEAPYLDEWLTYHRSVAGFSEIYLFDNSRPDGLELYNSSRYTHCPGVVTIPWPKVDAPQLEAYDMCVHMIREQNKRQGKHQRKTEWVGFFDIDEFVVFKDENESVVDLLQDLVPLSPPPSRFRYKRPANVALSINWVMFGTSNHTKYSPEPVTKRFRYHQTRATQYIVKQIVLLDAILKVNHPHFAELEQLLSHDYITTIPNGTKVQNEHPFIDGARDRVVLHHYAIKSPEELYIKGCLRGRADLPTDHKHHKVRCNNTQQIFAGTIYDDSAWQALKKWVPAYGTLYEDH